MSIVIGGAYLLRTVGIGEIGVTAAPAVVAAVGGVVASFALSQQDDQRWLEPPRLAATSVTSSHPTEVRRDN